TCCGQGPPASGPEEILIRATRRRPCGNFALDLIGHRSAIDRLRERLQSSAASSRFRGIIPAPPDQSALVALTCRRHQSATPALMRRGGTAELLWHRRQLRRDEYKGGPSGWPQAPQCVRQPLLSRRSVLRSNTPPGRPLTTRNRDRS